MVAKDDGVKESLHNMIDLKRNSKKELVPAPGKRVRASSIYQPNQSNDFKISRGRFTNYLNCQRCFYLDRVKGLDEPGTPGWTLNETTDILLKKEFDKCRELQVPHRLMDSFNLSGVVPFKHPDLDKWRNSLHQGLMSRFKDTNIILTGGVDDVWEDTNDNSLIVVDYKSQANSVPVTPEYYLSHVYHEGYKIQMDFYAYLLQEMGFTVSKKSYFLVCNADREANGFYGQMNFSETLIPYKWSSDWIPEKVENMITLMNQHDVPDPNPSCKNCAYAKQRTLMDVADQPTF